MKQKPDGPESEHPRPGDEGARYTKQLMTEVTRLRNSMQPRWSAERLAEEMTKVGVPWTRNAVVNLESGRRKQIAIHEVLALAYVLNIAPAVLMSGLDDQATVPITPRLSVSASEALNWMQGLQSLPGSDDDMFLRNMPPGMSGALPVNIDQALEALDRVRESIEARRPLQARMREIREQALGIGEDRADGEG